MLQAVSKQWLFGLHIRAEDAVVLKETLAEELPIGISDCSKPSLLSSTGVEKSSAIKVMGVNQEHQLGQRISSCGQILLLIHDFTPAVVSSIS